MNVGRGSILFDTWESWVLSSKGSRGRLVSVEWGMGTGFSKLVCVCTCIKEETMPDSTRDPFLRCLLPV